MHLLCERYIANLMLNELEWEFLDVILIPAPDPKFEGHMIRAVQNRNPYWYQGQGFKRYQVKIALNRIRFNLPLYCTTDHRVKHIIQNRLTKLKI